MKNTIILIITFFVATASASDQAKKIYEALMVKEETVAAVGITAGYKKSIGGLVCIKSDMTDAPTITNQPFLYSCKLDSAKLDPEKIYSALNIEEKKINNSRTKPKYEKIIGNLICTKQTKGRFRRSEISCTLSDSSSTSTSESSEAALVNKCCNGEAPNCLIEFEEL